MTRQTTPRRRRTAPVAITPRAVLLAGLGAASLARKQAIRQLADAAANAEALRARADAAAVEAGRKVAKLRKQAAGFAAQAEAEFEARFLKPKRSPRRTTRPAAKRARKRA